jgi:hypothetical protein
VNQSLGRSMSAQYQFGNTYGLHQSNGFLDMQVHEHSSMMPSNVFRTCI